MGPAAISRPGVAVSLAIRWILAGVIIGLAAVTLARLAGWPAPAAPGPDPFLRWETCVLNDRPHCGPMPQP